MRRHRVLASAAAIALVPLLVACGGSPADIVQNQGTSGNGAFVKSAAIYAQNVVLVATPGNLGVYSLTGTWVNLSGSDDAIIAVAADGTNVPTNIQGLPTPLRAHTATQPGVTPLAVSANNIPFGTTSQILLSYTTAPANPILAGRYMKIRIAYRVNGVATMNVLVVPPIGYYAQFRPGNPGSN
jgi:hypothetical protein